MILRSLLIGFCLASAVVCASPSHTDAGEGALPAEDASESSSAVVEGEKFPTPYMQDCKAKGVPSPLVPVGKSPWKKIASNLRSGVNGNLESTTNYDLWKWEAGEGTCIAAPRTTGQVGVICAGKKGTVCFYDGIFKQGELEKVLLADLTQGGVTEEDNRSINACSYCHSPGKIWIQNKEMPKLDAITSPNPNGGGGHWKRNFYSLSGEKPRLPSSCISCHQNSEVTDRWCRIARIFVMSGNMPPSKNLPPLADRQATLKEISSVCPEEGR